MERRKERALSMGIEESKIADNIAVICSNPEVDIVIEVMGGVEPAVILYSRFFQLVAVFAE